MFQSFAKLLFKPPPPGAGPPLDGIVGVGGAFSMSRNLLSSYSGPFFNDIAGKVDVINDQTGLSNRNFLQATDANRPTLITAGNQNRQAADFDGVTGKMDGAVYNTYIPSFEGYIIISVIVDTISSNEPATDANETLFTDGGGRLGIGMRSIPNASSYIFSGGSLETPTIPISLSTTFIAEWYKTGDASGDCFCRINGANEQSVASGFISNSGSIRIGSTNTESFFTDYKIFEMAFIDTTPNVATRDQLVSDFLTHVE